MAGGRSVVRVLAVGAGVVLGAVTAFAGLLVHRQALRIGGQTLPWGLALALAASYALLRAASLSGGVPAAAGVAVGWVGVMLDLQRTRPEGDFLIAADWLGYGFVLGGTAVVVVGVVQAVSESRRTPTDRADRADR